MGSSGVLIYDGDCQFCQLSLEFGIRHMKVFPKYVASQRINPADFGLSQADVRAQIWLFEPGNDTAKRLGGHLAAGAILLGQPNVLFRAMGWLISTPPTSWLAYLAYRFIAANRHRLPGGSRQCKIEDDYFGN